jgi:energy-coupling factor transporter ATP-binding protein EcfA2
MIQRDEYERRLLHALKSHPEKRFVATTFINEKWPGFEAARLEELRDLLEKLAAAGLIDREEGQGVTMYCHKKGTAGAGMIHTLRAKNYGCLLDVTATLTPLHAFIGPNDSGKSTLLRAIRTVFHLVKGNAKDSVFELGLDLDSPGSLIGVTFADELSYEISVEPNRKIRRTPDLDQSYSSTLGAPTEPKSVAVLRRHLEGVRLLRLDPDALRRPSNLISSGAKVDFFDERGTGLPAVYDAIIDRDVEVFIKVLNEVRSLFGSVAKLGLTTIGSSGAIQKALQATLIDGRMINAALMSEGLLYYLAFAAVSHLDPVSAILVEEPENGLHPARIAEVVKILRAISEAGIQVVMATHSPLVVNELSPDEVSVVTRTTEKGTQVKRIKDTPDFEARSKVYALGELWIAYANGEDEAPLLEGREP